MDSSKHVHLVVLQHGLWGYPAHLETLHKTLQDSFVSCPVRVVSCDANAGKNTYDGIDICGDRLVAFIKQEAAQFNVTKITLIGYSMGGLITRYAVGRLAQEGFFDKVQPCNFITIATPHLGSWRLPQSWMDRTFNKMVPMMTSRTGYQLVLADKHAWGLPLLYLLSHKSLVFHRALQRFQNLMLFASIKFDRTVPYCTAAICAENPYESCLPVTVDSKYPSIVRTAEPTEQVEKKRYAGRLRMMLLLMFLPLLLILWVVLIIQGKRHYAQTLKQQLGMEFDWLEGSQTQQQADDVPAASPRGAAELQSAADATEQQEQASSPTSDGDAADRLDAYADRLPLSNAGDDAAVGRRRSSADITEIDLQMSAGDAQTSALPAAQHMFHFDEAPPTGVTVAASLSAAEQSGVSSSGMMHIVDHDGLVEAPSRLHGMQKLMISHMNELPWKKVDVDAGHYHAHAAIVCRDKRYGNYGRDVLQYCADNLVL